jgi:hypothetical protein
MELPLGIKPLPLQEWTNAHSNFSQTLKKGASFDLTVSDPEFTQVYRTFQERYNQTTKNIQWLIKHAIEKKQRLRPMGSGWSFSKVAVSEHGIINTKKLRLKAQLAETQVSPAYLARGGDPSNMLFAQCGNTIISINDLLEKERNPAKSLRASGGSNGQTIVGAFSTGTHGAAYRFGALTEFVVGLHLVVGPDRHVWVEKASNPVTSEAFRTWMGAEVILDDELFNAALVSFGSFGFIHGVLIETEPRFLLEQEMMRIPYDAGLEKAIRHGDFSGLAASMKYPLPVIEDTLYHFELAINPHRFKKEDPEQGAYLRVMYKQPYRTGYNPVNLQTGKYTYGDDVLGLMQQVLDLVEKLPGNKLDLALIPKTVNTLFNLAYNRPEAGTGTVGETFRNTIFRGKLFSAAYAFDRADIPEVIDVILDLMKQFPFAGAVALRFVKGTEATLGFTRFPHSCVLELDGVDAKANHDFARAFTERIERDQIRYAIHWGKINQVLNAERVRSMYGNLAVDQWLHQRRRLLSDEAREVFNNGFLERCGLAGWPEVIS